MAHVATTSHLFSLVRNLNLVTPFMLGECSPLTHQPSGSRGCCSHPSIARPALAGPGVGCQGFVSGGQEVRWTGSQAVRWSCGQVARCQASGGKLVRWSGNEQPSSPEGGGLLQPVRLEEVLDGHDPGGHFYRSIRLMQSCRSCSVKLLYKADWRHPPPQVAPSLWLNKFLDNRSKTHLGGSLNIP